MKNIFFLLFLCGPTLLFGQSSTPSISLQQSFSKFVQVANSPAYTGASMMAFSVKENTEGNPYFFNNWGSGRVYLSSKEAFNEPSDVLNFDKTNQALLLKISEKEVIEVNMNEIDSFYIIDSGKVYHFVKFTTEPVYALQLYRDSAYSAFKVVSTKFYKADYVNKGLYESGYRYDRYLDKKTYYLKDSRGENISLEKGEKKDLKKLAAKIPAINDFIKLNLNADDKDVYVTSLAKYLNSR